MDACHRCNNRQDKTYVPADRQPDVCFLYRVHGAGGAPRQAQESPRGQELGGRARLTAGARARSARGRFLPLGIVLRPSLPPSLETSGDDTRVQLE